MCFSVPPFPPHSPGCSERAGPAETTRDQTQAPRAQPGGRNRGVDFAWAHREGERESEPEKKCGLRGGEERATRGRARVRTGGRHRGGGLERG